MKTGKIIIAIAALGLALTAGAKSQTDEQKALRLDIMRQLKAAGLTPTRDEDADIAFTKDGVKHYVVIDESWNSPYLYTVYSQYPYDSEKDYTRQNMEALISLINLNKTVKLACDKEFYTLRSDVMCKDAGIFEQTYEAILDEQQKAHNQIVTVITSGLGGMDLTGNKEGVHARATQYYDDEDYSKAFKLFKYLADEGYVPAYSYLAECYMDGLGVAKDEDLMVEYYEKAIDGGTSWCTYDLGNFYYNKGNFPKALELYKLCSGSDNAFRTDAYYKMGEMYEKGQGVAPNLTTAIQCYRKSVQYAKELESDARVALNRLGETVESVNDFVDISPAILGGMSAVEMYKKGEEYENGRNHREVSLPKAYGYFKAAADRNYAKACLKMGEIYVSKYYPFKDKAKSDKYFEKALKGLKQQASSNPEAAYQLAMMYKNGRGVAADSDQAIILLKAAADKGSTDANYDLGSIYMEEDIDAVVAFNRFMKAAEKGHAKAMFEVAKAYETGMGTGRNKDQAVAWYTKCAASGDAVASDASAALKRLGTTDDEKE